MNSEAWTILVVGTALGGLMWQMLRTLRQDMVRQFSEGEESAGSLGRGPSRPCP